MIVGFQRTKAFLAPGKKLDRIFTSAFAALQTLDEAHDWLSLLASVGFPTLSLQPRQGQKKKPHAKRHGAFSKPFRSCLAVFYVEQVALNRHVHRPKTQRALETKSKLISAARWPSSRTFPARQARHFPFRERRLRRA